MFIFFNIKLLLFIQYNAAYKTSLCLGDNQEFTLCGWKCPPTCLNLVYLYREETFCEEKWSCYVGCQCMAGFILDEYSKNCVHVQDCPGVDNSARAVDTVAASTNSLNLPTANVAGIGQLVTPNSAQSPGVYGVFPNANPAGCNVPLLFSCAPTIIPGRFVKNSPQMPYPSGFPYPMDFNGYRSIDEIRDIQDPLSNFQQDLNMQEVAASTNDETIAKHQ
ncbi:unnamed protein product, partial [Leptidea sinapis]